jgi:hypothetical protein
MDKEQVSAAPADREAWMQEATMTDLHAQIMNIPCKPYDGTDAYTHYCRGHRDARHAAAELASEALRTAAPAVQQDGWMPIESAPKNRKVLVAYRNSLGKWRRVMACHYTESEIAEWENDDSTPGWYEECESQEVILPVEGTPELWHELPPIDAAADHIADAGEMVAAAVPALPVAWMKRRAVSAEWDAYDFSANRSDEFCIPLYAAPVAACACGPDCQDEGPPTCRYTHAAPVAAPAARATWFDPSTGMTLRQRCSVALECLPEAPYRQQLARLLDDLMVAPAAEAQLRQLPGEPEEEYLGRRAEAQTLEPTWVLLLRHGMSPVRKGPFFADAPIEQMVRDLYALHADATVIVINMPVTAYPMSGREWVAMHGDRRRKAIPGAPSPQRPMVMLTEEVQAVLSEVERATRKFPTWPTDPLHALAVLGEEFGELTKDMLQLTYEPHKTSAEAVRAEAIQTAAMALRLVMSLERYEYARSPQHSQDAAKNGAAVAPKENNNG